MLYVHWTSSQIHHAMHTTGVVNIYHEIQEVTNATRHPDLALLFYSNVISLC